MIETGLVYVYATKPARRFVGCGALVERGFIATCRHVWVTATKGWTDGKPLVDIEYPHAGTSEPATLQDRCEGTDGRHPDLVLLKPKAIPSEHALQLQLATRDSFEIGDGFSIAGIVGRDVAKPDTVMAGPVQGSIIEFPNPKGQRPFTGNKAQGFWFTSGSSGSPVFLKQGQQLAGIISLSELGYNEGEVGCRKPLSFRRQRFAFIWAGCSPRRRPTPKVSILISCGRCWMPSEPARHHSSKFPPACSSSWKARWRVQPSRCRGQTAGPMSKRRSVPRATRWASWTRPERERSCKPRSRKKSRPGPVGCCRC
jgi:hypothetical protein